MPWIDNDDPSDYGDRVRRESKSNVDAMNQLVHEHREFDIYGMIPDDAWIVTPGWSKYVQETIDGFPNRVGVVSPSHSYGDYIDMPFVSREWVDGLGYFAYPHMFHYCWTLVTGLLGEATNIVYAPRDKFHIEHDHKDSPQMGHYGHDAKSFFNHFMLEHRKLIESLRRMACR